jgi:hypothetical protein
MQEASEELLEFSVGPKGFGFGQLLLSIDSAACDPDKFPLETSQITTQQAEHLLAVMLHKGMAYQEEIMPWPTACRLAQSFVSEIGEGAEFFSTTRVNDRSITGWSFQVTRHTFEAILLCIGQDQSALLVVTDED